MTGIRAGSEDFRDALEDMTWQFAYRGTRGTVPVLHTGGLSALEHAFDVLGWDDPHECEEEMSCDVEGCFEWTEAGSPWNGEKAPYLRLCSPHYRDSYSGALRPPLKARAIERESHRDPVTGRMP